MFFLCQDGLSRFIRNFCTHIPRRLLLAEAALKVLETEGALETAEAAFVRRGDYAGVRFVARLNTLHSAALRRAEVLCYFRDFDAAEAIYHAEDRRFVSIEYSSHESKPNR